MERCLTENEESCILQLDTNESDKILGDNEHDRAAVFSDIYLFADDFFERSELTEISVNLDIGEIYSILVKEFNGHYFWKKAS